MCLGPKDAATYASQSCKSGTGKVPGKRVLVLALHAPPMEPVTLGHRETKTWVFVWGCLLRPSAALLQRHRQLLPVSCWEQECSHLRSAKFKPEVLLAPPACSMHQVLACPPAQHMRNTVWSGKFTLQLLTWVPVVVFRLVT